MNNGKTCCIIGSKRTDITLELENTLYSLFKKMLTEDSVGAVLFCGKNDFDLLCHRIIGELRMEYDVSRVYVRGNHPNMTKKYERFILELYEDTCYPNVVLGAEASADERMRYMIDKSDICVFCLDLNHTTDNAQISSVRRAYEYAVKQSKTVINVEKTAFSS